jgi:hypothetical protein
VTWYEVEEDGYPESGQTVLVRCAEFWDYAIAFRSSGEWHEYTHGELMPCGVTHWAHIFEPEGVRR